MAVAPAALPAAAAATSAAGMIFQYFLSMKDNQFVQLAIVGAVTGSAYKVQQLFRMLWRRFLHAFRCEVRLQNREKDLYDAVIAFISRQKMVRSAVLLAEKKKVRYSWSERVKQWATGEDPKPELELKPDNAQALYTFLYQGKRIAMYR